MFLPVSTTGPSVCVLVLNWNGLADTLECIASVRRSDYQNFSLLVIDNGSADNSIAAIAEAHPEVELISNGANLGWAGGNNVGIDIALQRGYEYVFLLNNDAVVSEDCLSQMVYAMRKVGPCLLHPAIYYYSAPSVPQLDPFANTPSADRSSAVEIDHAYGAALLVPATIFRSIGYFDENFFLQLEETDFYFRSRKVGMKAFVIPIARVLHKESMSFSGKQTPVKTYYITRNSLLLIAKHASGPAEYFQLLKKLYWTIAALAKQAATRRGARNFSTVRWLFGNEQFARAVRGGIADFCLRRFGPISGKLRSKIG